VSAHIHLGLVFHQHQPVGNTGFVFDELYAKSYDPLVSSLERHPGVNAGLHFSGPLLDWLQEHRPGYIQRVRALVGRGQVEILGGGYYEPVLPAISEQDRVGQMRKMREAIHRMFGDRPSGMWLPERVWEPSLPSSINAAGYSWTIVDDVHFEGAGFHADELRGWYLTEYDGQRLGIFGSSTRFRYLVPWGTVDSCVDFLRAAGDRAPGSLVAMGDDGEKFGGWPTTFAHCWEEGWVDEFFARLERESAWIATVKLGEWQAGHRPESLAYLPATSYMEMGEWSLPPGEQGEMEEAKAILRGQGRDDLVRFLRGGHWRNFLVRYPEVNRLQKRILALSEAAHAANNAEALEHLWMAQCNCPFWHGVFGGVYLEHIRHANFGHVAAADAALFPGEQPPDIRDWDFDGADEVCLRSATHAVVVSPARGGSAEDWELRQHAWHATHAVARRPEAYHSRLQANEAGELRSIHGAVRVKDPEALAHAGEYDRGMRVAAQDTLLGPGATRDDYRASRLAIEATAVDWEAAGQCLSMRLAAGEHRYAKEIRLDTALRTTYTTGPHLRLFSEWNLSLPDGPAGEHPEFHYGDGQLRVRTARFELVASHEAADVWHERLYSVSNTEDGIELAPQGWSVVFANDSGPAGGAFEIAWSVEG